MLGLQRVILSVNIVDTKQGYIEMSINIKIAVQN